MRLIKDDETSNIKHLDLAPRQPKHLKLYYWTINIKAVATNFNGFKILFVLHR